jgi:hypothetical protein
MAKSYKKRASSFVKSTSNRVNKALPVLNNGIKTASNVASNVAKETIPIVEKGVSAVYGTMNTGFNLGVKGAENVGKGIKSLKKRMSAGKRKHTRRRKHYKR